MKIDISIDRDNDEGGETGWLVHSYTQALARACRRQEAEALTLLVGTCRQSSDAKVVGALARYEHYRSVADFAEGKQEP